MPQELSDLIKKHSREIKIFSPGDVVEGTIVAIDRKYVLVDLGAKSEGIIALSEVKTIPNLTIEAGKKLTAIVLQPENRQGNLVLSLKKAKSQHSWGSLEEVFESGEP